MAKEDLAILVKSLLNVACPMDKIDCEPPLKEHTVAHIVIALFFLAA